MYIEKIFHPGIYFDEEVDYVWSHQKEMLRRGVYDLTEDDYTNIDKVREKVAKGYDDILWDIELPAFIKEFEAELEKYANEHFNEYMFCDNKRSGDCDVTEYANKDIFVEYVMDILNSIDCLTDIVYFIDDNKFGLYLYSYIKGQTVDIVFKPIDSINMTTEEREKEVYKKLNEIELNKEYDLSELDDEFEDAFGNYPISEDEWEYDYQKHWGTFIKDIKLDDYEEGSINTIEAYGNMYCDYGDIYVDVTFEKIDEYTIKLLKISY